MAVEPQPSIFIQGIEIMEPVTTFTDVLVTVVSFYVYFKLKPLEKLGKKYLYIRYFLVTLGISTFIGGVVGHGFLYAFSFVWKTPGWLVGMFAVTLLERAAIEHASELLKPRFLKFFKTVNLIELIAFVIITFVTLNFTYVQVHGAYGLLVVVFSFHLYNYRKTRNTGSLYFLGAVGIMALASAIFSLQLAPHKWFNHADLSHILMCLAVLFAYKGTLNLSETDKPQQVQAAGQ